MAMSRSDIGADVLKAKEWLTELLTNLLRESMQAVRFVPPIDGSLPPPRSFENVPPIKLESADARMILIVFDLIDRLYRRMDTINDELWETQEKIVEARMEYRRTKGTNAKAVAVVDSLRFRSDAKSRKSRIFDDYVRWVSQSSETFPTKIQVIELLAEQYGRNIDGLIRDLKSEKAARKSKVSIPTYVNHSKHQS